MRWFTGFFSSKKRFGVQTQTLASSEMKTANSGNPNHSGFTLAEHGRVTQKLRLKGVLSRQPVAERGEWEKIAQ